MLQVMNEHADIFSNQELDEEFRASVDFAKGSKLATGFGYLDETGHIKPDSPVELWITCRMTHVFALASLYGIEWAKEYAQHGVNCLTKYFADPVYGGWYSAIDQTADSDGNGIPLNNRKEAYAHAFVVLAANSAFAAQCAGAEELLIAAEQNQTEYWFDASAKKVRESWDRSFSVTDDYRGINANMHTVEAYLAVADLRKNRELLDRAVGILEFVVEQARPNDWRIPEHYDNNWNTLPNYNRDEPAHPFRPFGITPGHGLEWSRLMLQGRQSLIDAGETDPEWMLEGAVSLYRRAVADGWQVDGAPGFIYTTDFSGQPVVHQRMHWVLCEAIGAGVIQDKVLAESDPANLDRELIRQNIRQWWAYAGQYLRESTGRWHHELDAENCVAGETWSGKPDVYHLSQMLLLPRLPISPAFATALKDGMLEPISPELSCGEAVK